MFTQFMSDFVDKDTLKVVSSVEAKQQVINQSGVVFIHSPLLYKLYAMYADGKPIESRPTFYRKVGAYVFYDYFNCDHGSEYYYYIKINENSNFYREHKEFIERSILAADPSTLKNYNGHQRVDVFNKELKERYL